jgi:hypothetical protein
MLALVHMLFAVEFRAYLLQFFHPEPAHFRARVAAATKRGIPANSSWVRVIGLPMLPGFLRAPFPPGRKGGVSNSLIAAFFGANAHRSFDGQDEQLAVADLARLAALDDRG